MLRHILGLIGLATRHENEMLRIRIDQLEIDKRSLRHRAERTAEANTQLTRQLQRATGPDRDLFIAELKRRRSRIRELGDDGFCRNWETKAREYDQALKSMVDDGFCRNWETKAREYDQALKSMVDNRSGAEIAADAFMGEIGGKLDKGIRLEAYSATSVSGGPGVSRPEENIVSVKGDGDRLTKIEEVRRLGEKG